MRAYILADNKLALNAGWDEKLLQLELNELKSRVRESWQPRAGRGNPGTAFIGGILFAAVGLVAVRSGTVALFLERRRKRRNPS